MTTTCSGRRRRPRVLAGYRSRAPVKVNAAPPRRRGKFCRGRRSASPAYASQWQLRGRRSLTRTSSGGPGHRSCRCSGRWTAGERRLGRGPTRLPVSIVPSPARPATSPSLSESATKTVLAHCRSAEDGDRETKSSSVGGPGAASTLPAGRGGFGGSSCSSAPARLSGWPGPLGPASGRPGRHGNGEDCGGRRSLCPGR